MVSDVLGALLGLGTSDRKRVLGLAKLIGHSGHTPQILMITKCWLTIDVIYSSFCRNMLNVHEPVHVTYDLKEYTVQMSTVSIQNIY